MNPTTYQTITAPVQAEFKDKGSRFIAFVYPVQTVEAVKHHVEALREAHHKARHWCYAYRLGTEGVQFRANDDGEPSGSAGLPIYNQLLAHNLTNILVVIIRYYGGTKLGVSGLVKTYKESAKLTLEHTEIITKELETQLEIEFKFSQQNIIFSLLNKFDAKVLNFDAQENCKITAQLKLSEKEKISEQLSEMYEVKFDFIEN